MNESDLRVRREKEGAGLDNDEQTSVTDLLRRFTKLWLPIMETQRTPGASIVIRQGDTEQRLVVL